MDDFDKNSYEKVLASYDERQLVYEMAIVKKQETNLYIKKRALDEEFRRRLEAN